MNYVEILIIRIWSLLSVSQARQYIAFRLGISDSVSANQSKQGQLLHPDDPEHGREDPWGGP